MDNKSYLLAISVSGIKNIKNEVQLDFYKKTIDKNFDPEKYRVKAIYGENGAGKSAIVTSVDILRRLMTDRRYLSETRNQIFLENIINKTTQSLVIKSEILTKINEDNYVMKYAVKLEKNKEGIYAITAENLSYKNGNYNNDNYKNLYDIKNGEIKSLALIEKDVCISKTMNLLDTQSFLHNYILMLLDKTVSSEPNSYLILEQYLFATSVFVYMDEEDKHDSFTLKKYLETAIKSDDKNDILKEISSHYNKEIGISEQNIRVVDYAEYEMKVKKLAKFLKVFKPDLVGISVDKKENGEFYKCSLVINYEDYNVDTEFESTGIKKLIRLFDCFTKASNRGIVFIDELDSNVNDVYFCKLVEYFMYYGKGQLCFTTHNLDPMNILKENKYSIDFLSSINTIHPWVSNGNATPDNYYKNGMIEDIPFNVDATDFVGMFEEE
ncbi:MAG: ATP-binding protein [Lachnospiraceae bacterium]|nr:ATP-binding protein [Lachnospiraceae bacterium]